MVYVVHVFGNTRYRFDDRKFPEAFRMFKEMQRHYRGVAMWHGKAGEWLRVYATEGYPEHMQRPFGHEL